MIKIRNEIKYMLFACFLFGVILSINPINAINDDGYVVNINGVDLKIPNGFVPDSEPMFDEDNTDIYGLNVHIYGIEYYGDNGYLMISTTTGNSEPLTNSYAMDAGGNVQNISGIVGKLKTDNIAGVSIYRFTYEKNNVIVCIESDNLDLIKYCVNTTTN